MYEIRNKNWFWIVLNSDGCVCAANGNAACDGKIADYCITRWIKTIIGEVVTEIFLSISRLIFAKLTVFYFGG